MALPFLPGNSFTDPTKTRFHVSHTLGYRNGYPLPARPRLGVGGHTLQVNQLSDEALDELATTQPTLTYGRPRREAPVEFVPAHVAFDKKVLLFDAYFKQTVHESPDEFYRVRRVKIYYYLEDDTISVVEPPVENSGIPQGKLIKRHRLPKNDLGDLWTWRDLNLGMDIVFYGTVYHITSCDSFTAEFMAIEGIELAPPEIGPPDPHMLTRLQPPHTHTTPSTHDRLQQFLKRDRQVLRFYCLWDDRDEEFGEMRPYLLHYYLVDDTVEVREVHEPNDGRDPYPVLVTRQRLPKDRYDLPSSFPSCVLESSDHELQNWFHPEDLSLGKTVSILGRKFLLYDCDEFTKQFYRTHYNIQDFSPLTIQNPPAPQPTQPLSPHNGFGSPEDSLQSCLSLIPQPPRKDVIKMLENDGKVLRYAAVMESGRPEDQMRKFIICYFLSDDTISIFEPPQRNAGVLGGKFLEKMRVVKPTSTPDQLLYYSPQDLQIGATIEVLKHRFTLTDCDAYVVKYAETNPLLFSETTLQSLGKKHGHHQPHPTTSSSS